MSFILYYLLQMISLAEKIPLKLFSEIERLFGGQNYFLMTTVYLLEGKSTFVSKINPLKIQVIAKANIFKPGCPKLDRKMENSLN